MTFQIQLNEYLSRLRCTNKELAAACDLSEGAISRYRKGHRTPTANSVHIKKLAHGMCRLADKQGIYLEEDEVVLRLRESTGNDVALEYDAFIINLRQLLSVVGLTNRELANELNYDPSYISRILSGKRRPGHIKKFIDSLTLYISRQQIDSQRLEAIARLVGCDVSQLSAQTELHDAVMSWLCSSDVMDSSAAVMSFLKKLDAFSHSGFAGISAENTVGRALGENETKRSYSGLENAGKAKLDFLTTVLERNSADSLIMYSDINETGYDYERLQFEFLQKLGLLLDKKAEISVIVDIYQPLDMLSRELTRWIPLFSYPELSLYSFNQCRSPVFNHMLGVSLKTAISGEAIGDDSESCRFEVTSVSEDVEYQRKRAEQLLARSQPFATIYSQHNKRDFYLTFNDFWSGGNKYIFCSCPPVFTMSENLLLRVLSKSSFSYSETQKIFNYRNTHLSLIINLLKTNRVTLNVPSLNREDFDRLRLSPDLSDMFIPGEISYSFSDYTEHIRQTKQFAERFSNCNLILNPEARLSSVSFVISEDSSVMVSKAQDSPIHLLAGHPKVVSAFERFTL